MPKKRTKTTIIPKKTAKIMKDASGKEHILVIEQEDYFTFANLRAGKIFFTREDGKEDVFDGLKTKDDISRKEREILLGSWDYKNGYLVEEKEKEESNAEIINKNSLNDAKIEFLIEKHKDDYNKLEDFIKGVSSDFVVRRLKDAFIRHNLPSSLVVYCDYKIKLIEEEFLKSKEAPVDSFDVK